MSKKKKKKLLTFLEAYKKMRKVWGFAPVSKVLDKNKKKMSRAKIKRNFKKELDKE